MRPSRQRKRGRDENGREFILPAGQGGLKERTREARERRIATKARRHEGRTKGKNRRSTAAGMIDRRSNFGRTLCALAALRETFQQWCYRVAAAAASQSHCGVTATNAPSYLDLPNVLCVGGSWVAPDAMVQAGDWSGIERLARDASGLRAGR